MRAERKFVHGLELVPSWRAPHHFTAFRGSLERWSASETRHEQFVFTSGLLAHDVVAADLTTAQGVRELGEKLGFEWLGSYADAVLVDSITPGPSPLTEWATSIGVSQPGEPSSSRMFGEPLPDDVPADVLEAFAKLAPRLATFPEHQSLDLFVRELVRAARKREAPRPTSEQREHVLRHVSLDEAGLQSTTGGWAIEFPNLYARVWYELFEVFEARPTLYLCPLCKRVYVPRVAAQRRCNRALYTWPVGARLRGCVPEPRIKADEHRREYKRLAEAVRRAKQSHGESSQEARAAQEALDAYRQDEHYPGRVGRPSKEKPVMRQRKETHG